MQQKNGQVLASSGRKNKEHVIYIYVSENRAYHGISLKKSPNDPKWPFKEEEDYHSYWKLGCHILVENKRLGGSSIDISRHYIILSQFG